MPIPRHSTALPSVQLAGEAANGGVTELRVHGVGGTPPDAILGDLAPEQVMGDAIAGFYRTSDHRASAADQAGRLDVDRHVEVYSWGGLTSRSKIRVLWLALLPFLLANLAGWMCPAGTRNSAWKFRLHRLAAGLGSLALTVNAIRNRGGDQRGRDRLPDGTGGDRPAPVVARAAGLAVHRRVPGPPGDGRGAGPGAVRAGAGLAGQPDLAL